MSFLIASVSTRCDSRTVQHFVNVLFVSASDEDEENKQRDFKSFVLCHSSQPVTSRSTTEQPFSHYVNKQMNELDAGLPVVSFFLQPSLSLGTCTEMQFASRFIFVFS